jgi:PPM family protein phosphatase
MTRVTAAGHTFEVSGFSEQGPRSENQDALLLETFTESGLLAVADGMGGEKSGRVAADTALEALRRAAPLRSLDEARRAVRDADRRVADASASNPQEFGGMGCALGLLALSDGRDGPGWFGAHVGDVRIVSRSPDGVVRLETRDHTPAFARWEAGEITLDEIPDSTGANRLQRAVGRGGEPDAVWLPIGAGWTWLIISDGVYKAMRLDELAAATANGTVAEACQTIRRKVDERGADDNYTALVVRAIGGPAPPTTAPAEDRNLSRTNMAPNTAPRRVIGGGIATALALLALALAGLALWTAWNARPDPARQTELHQLRLEVDSLRSIVDQLNDPFGPAVPDQVPGTATPTTPIGP